MSSIANTGSIFSLIFILYVCVFVCVCVMWFGAFPGAFGQGEHSPSAREPVPEQRAPGKCSVPRPGSPVPSSRREERGCGPVTGKDRASCQSGGAPALRPGAIAQSPGREAALAWESLAQRFPASSVLAREGAGCGSVGDVPGALLASAPLWPSLWT